MPESTWLAERFEETRGHLRAVAFRMLGSSTEADDAVQEAWLRLSRTDVSAVENLGGWLTTVVARVCLDMLRSRKARREEPFDVDASDARKLRQSRPRKGWLWTPNEFVPSQKRRARDTRTSSVPRYAAC